MNTTKETTLVNEYAVRRFHRSAPVWNIAGLDELLEKHTRRQKQAVQGATER